MIIDSSSVTAGFDEEQDELYIHGWIMWVAWGVLGLIQIISFRYMIVFPWCNDRISYRLKLAIHIINGLIMLILTILMSVKAINYYDGKLRWNESVHSAMGLAVLFATGVITILGLLTWGA